MDAQCVFRVVEGGTDLAECDLGSLLDYRRLFLHAPQLSLHHV